MAQAMSVEPYCREGLPTSFVFQGSMRRRNTRKLIHGLLQICMEPGITAGFTTLMLQALFSVQLGRLGLEAEGQTWLLQDLCQKRCHAMGIEVVRVVLQNVPETSFLAVWKRASRRHCCCCCHIPCHIPRQLPPAAAQGCQGRTAHTVQVL